MADPQIWPPITTQDVQTLSEGVVDDPDRIEFLGERFRLAEAIGLMPLMAFAATSKQGANADDMAGLAAMYQLIRDTVDQTRPPTIDPATGEQKIDAAGEPEWDGPSEWMRFEQHAIDAKADGEDLMDFIGRAMSVVAARPRKPRSGSSPGSRPTPEKLRDDSSSPAIRRTIPQAEGLVSVMELAR